jgi:DNA-binding response OmpR family regulator
MRTQEGKEQVIKAFEDLLDEADQALDAVVDIRPKAEVVVVGGPYGGYYVSAPLDGSRPGTFFVNLDYPTAHYRMPTLTYHETIPGHHLQVALARELDLPTFRRALVFNAYAEGWALYAEAVMRPYLPLEAQMISLQYRLMRAARMFLDPMLNLGLISPDEARRLIVEDMATGESWAQNEIERYTYRIPGQATAYYYGYSKMQALRAQTETASIPFVFLTARADRSFMRQGMELGADDYVTKPFTLEELRNAIAARLKRQEMLAQSAEQDVEQARRALVRLVSHELRTPLVSINTATEIISRQMGQLSRTQLEELLESLRRGGQRLSRLVEQVVLFVQIESGSLRKETIRINGQRLRILRL